MVRRIFSGMIVMAALGFAGLGATQAPRERRLALVVGNDRYAGVMALQNARRDSAAIADELRTIGFQATLLQDATRAQLIKAIETLSSSITASDVVIFYYAGHGAQVQGENYLIPIDYKGDSEQGLTLEGIPAGQVQTWLARARVSILVLDACRNNPYSGQRSFSRGLAPMEARGSLVAFATAAGQTAGDNPAGSQGTFTGALLDMLRVPGLTLREVFFRVRQRVYDVTAGRQFPAVYDNLLGDVVLRPAADSSTTPPPAPPPAAVPPPSKPPGTGSSGGSSVVPEWLIGDFRGVSAATNAHIELTVQPDGSISGLSGVGQGRATPVQYEWVPATQQIRDTSGAYVFDVERTADGFRTRLVGLASNSVAYQRVYLPPGSRSATTTRGGAVVDTPARQPTPDERATMVAVINEWKKSWETLDETAGRVQFPAWTTKTIRAEREKEGISKVSATLDCPTATVRRDQAQIRCRSTLVVDYKQPLVSSSRGRVQIGGQKPPAKAVQMWTLGLFWNGTTWLIESFER